MKYYAQKSSAIRAAKKAGLANFEIELTTDGFGIIKGEAALKVENSPLTMRQEMDTFIREFQESIGAAQTDDHIKALYLILNERTDLSEAVAAQLDEDIGIRAEEIEATRSAIGEPKSPNIPKAQKEWIRASSVERPTKLVWAIADSMPGASRAEVQAACVKAGIASGTARTQYQHWFKTLHDSENEARAQIVDGKLIPAAK